MDPLIESLKRDDEVTGRERSTANEIRLHDSNIIFAKAPGLCLLLAERLRRLCSEMQQAFPHNSKRNPTVETISNGFIINGGGLPRRILSAQLDLVGQRLTLSERIKNEVEDDPTPEIKPPIRITVGSQEELRFHFAGTAYDDPQDLARALIRYICGLPQTQPVTPLQA